MAIWNAGACHASVSLRAIVRRSDVSGMRSISPVGAGAGTVVVAVGAGLAAARSTSSATTRPSRVCDLLGGRRLPAALALGFGRRPGGTFFLRSFGGRLRRCSRERGHVFALLADHGDRRPDVRLAFCDRNLEQDAGGLGFDLLRHLVGVELVDLSVSSS